MSFVTEPNECPRCGGAALRTFHIETWDWWMICKRCGFEESFCGIWDGDGWRTAQGYRHPGPKREHRVEARGSFCLKSRHADTLERGTLAEDFTADMLDAQFDLVLLERDYDPTQSYIAMFDPDSGAISLLWGSLQPPMFEEPIDDPWR